MVLVGIAPEVEAEHLGGLPLVPARPGQHVDDRRHPRVVLGDVGGDDHRRGVRHRRQPAQDFEPLLELVGCLRRLTDLDVAGPIDRREPAEERKTPGCGGHRTVPAVAPDPHLHGAVLGGPRRATDQVGHLGGEPGEEVRGLVGRFGPHRDAASAGASSTGASSVAAATASERHPRRGVLGGGSTPRQEQLLDRGTLGRGVLGGSSILDRGTLGRGVLGGSSILGRGTLGRGASSGDRQHPRQGHPRLRRHRRPQRPQLPPRPARLQPPVPRGLPPRSRRGDQAGCRSRWFHFCCTSSPAIICCRMTMPSINASGRGGQPGTYTSTGITWSTPLVTEYESQ